MYKSPGAPSPGIASPFPAERNRVPVSTPAGTFTFIVELPSTTPFPECAAKNILEPAAGEHFPKNIIRVVESTEPARAARPASRARERIVPEPVVSRALLRLIQHLVSLAKFLEFLLRRLVARIFV